MRFKTNKDDITDEILPQKFMCYICKKVTFYTIQEFKEHYRLKHDTENNLRKALNNWEIHVTKINKSEEAMYEKYSKEANKSEKDEKINHTSEAEKTHEIERDESELIFIKRRKIDLENSDDNDQTKQVEPIEEINDKTETVQSIENTDKDNLDKSEENTDDCGDFLQEMAQIDMINIDSPCSEFQLNMDDIFSPEKKNNIFQKPADCSQDEMKEFQYEIECGTKNNEIPKSSSGDIMIITHCSESLEIPKESISNANSVSLNETDSDDYEKKMKITDEINAIVIQAIENNAKRVYQNNFSPEIVEIFEKSEKVNQSEKALLDPEIVHEITESSKEMNENYSKEIDVSEKDDNIKKAREKFQTCLEKVSIDDNESLLNSKGVNKSAEAMYEKYSKLNAVLVQKPTKQYNQRAPMYEKYSRMNTAVLRNSNYLREPFISPKQKTLTYKSKATSISKSNKKAMKMFEDEPPKVYIENVVLDPLTTNKDVKTSLMNNAGYLIYQPESKSRVVRKMVSCQSCNEIFEDYFQLNEHRKIHLKTMQFRCMYCNAPYAEMVSLRMHVSRAHKDVKPYKCNLCLQSYLTIHEVIKHGHEMHNLRG